MFSAMTFRINEEIIEYLFKVTIDQESVVEMEQEEDSRKIVEHRGPNEEEGKPATVKRDEKKTGRNETCPCGSGKKYKKCHGK
jgi:preprotein translocase subunit SecA